MPSFSICFSSRISAVTPSTDASAAALSAITRGVRTLAGSLINTRAALIDSPICCPLTAAWATLSLVRMAASVMKNC